MVDRKGMYLGRAGEGDECEQNTLFGTLKELGKKIFKSSPVSE